MQDNDMAKAISFLDHLMSIMLLTTYDGRARVPLNIVDENLIL